MYKFSDKIIDNVHMGLTWNCSLSCPVCARTGAIESKKFHTLNKKNLQWESYKNLIDLPELYEFLLCGNYGDPIYYKYLLELCEYIKNKSASRIVIHTNGSYKTHNFWKQLCDILQPEDILIFSIDGTLENNNIYRINSNRESILNAIQVANSAERGPELIWKHIVFPYNFDTIETAVDQALDLKFDKIHLTVSYETDLHEYSLSWNTQEVMNRIEKHLLKSFSSYDVNIQEDEQCVIVEIRSLLNAL